jgi:hypothetical protein
MCPRFDGCSNSALITRSCVTAMPSTRSQAVLRPSLKTASASRLRLNDAQKSREGNSARNRDSVAKVIRKLRSISSRLSPKSNRDEGSTALLAG